MRLLPTASCRGLAATALAALSVLAGCPSPTSGDAGVDDVRTIDPSCDPDAATVAPLDPPPAGQGLQLHVTFAVPPGTERQQCWRFQLPSDQDLEIVHYEVAYNRGSHHMNLFRVLPSVLADPATHIQPDTGLTGDGESCFNAVDFSTYDLVVGAQTGNLDWHLPPGVAYRLHAHSEMLLQSHFVNAVTQCTPGDHAEVWINLWTATDPATVTSHLGTMFANNRGILIPPHSDRTFSTSCALPHGGNVIAMTGHFHSRGREFTVEMGDPDADPATQVIYRSAAWSEPPFTVLDTPVVLPPDGPLWYTCAFHNTTDLPITFGPHVEFEEHCNLFAYFYGAGAQVDPDSRAQYCF